MPTTINLVFVHGWSVTNLDTYGQLPIRLKNELAAAGTDVTVRDIYLGRYISFHDEVRLPDVSRAMESAVREQLADLLARGERFVCITHSTGGPVVRDWWQRYYSGDGATVSGVAGGAATGGGGVAGGAAAASGAAAGAGWRPCPMSHLIMLAPANFGSALAQLGKGTISRLASWFEKVEPGQGVLDWLELGSKEAWELNTKWILKDSPPRGTAAGSGEAGVAGTGGASAIAAGGAGASAVAGGSFYPFVLIGQSIDRKFYDHLNSYTGELGSDGVVRSAAANLNATLITIRQTIVAQPGQAVTQQDPVIDAHEVTDKVFRIVTGKSHSGDNMGIMSSVKADSTDTASAETVRSIIRCIQVRDDAAYDLLCRDFAQETIAVQAAEKVEVVEGLFRSKRYFIHDRYCMVIFRVTDSEGYAVTDYDLIFTAGEKNDPNHLPEGFFSDRQQNSRNKETVTYFVNYDILKGSPAVMDGGNLVRAATEGIDRLGLKVQPRPDSGFVRYLPLELVANKDFFDKMVRANATILIDICLERLVSREVFRLEGPVTVMPDSDHGSFKDVKPGDGCVGAQH